MVNFRAFSEVIERVILEAFPEGDIARVHAKPGVSSDGRAVFIINVVMAAKKVPDPKRSFYVAVDLMGALQEIDEEAAFPLVSYYSLKDARGIVPEAA